MIIDTFPFWSELEVLDIRLHELDSVVDAFVLVEATQDYRGNPKPLYFEENKHLFTKFLPKIKHFVIDFPENLDAHEQHIPNTPGGANWIRDRYQHDAIMLGLAHCGDDDIIIVSDCDEVPRADAIRRYNVLNRVVHLNMKQINHFLNTRTHDAPWYRSTIQSYWVLKQTTPSHLRNSGTGKSFDNAGWHFCYMGGPQRIVTKLQSFAHSEFQNLHDLESAKRHLDGNYPYVFDNDLPKYVLDNWEKFDKMGMISHTHSKWGKSDLVDNPLIPITPPRPGPIQTGPYRPAC
jgi:hypothetical protein